MWWHKLVDRWSKRDYVEFSLFTWLLVFCVLALLRFVQGNPPDLLFVALVSLTMIPVEFLIIMVFQKYSFRVDEIMDYPSLLISDFYGEQLSKSGKVLVFFYAEWCPFCHSAFHLLASLSCISYKIFKVNLSDEENPLWTSLKIKRIPALIAFDSGKEFWRREATYMVGLRGTVFKEADLIMKTED